MDLFSQFNFLYFSLKILCVPVESAVATVISTDTGIPAGHVARSVALNMFGVTGGGMNGQMGGPRGSGGLFNSPMPDR